MPIRPEDIDPSKLPVAFRGYDRDATDELLKRVAWDYRQALRAQEDRAETTERLERGSKSSRRGSRPSRPSSRALIAGRGRPHGRRHGPAHRRARGRGRAGSGGSCRRTSPAPRLTRALLHDGTAVGA